MIENEGFRYTLAKQVIVYVTIGVVKAISLSVARTILDSSFRILEEIMSNRTFQNSKFLILLTKRDIFETALHDAPFRDSYPDCPLDENPIDYIIRRLHEIAERSSCERELPSH